MTVAPCDRPPQKAFEGLICLLKPCRGYGSTLRVALCTGLIMSNHAKLVGHEQAAVSTATNMRM